MPTERRWVQDRRVMDLVKEISEPGGSSAHTEEMRQNLAKAASEKNKQLEKEGNLDLRIERLKAGIEGSTASRPLDFKRVDFNKYTDNNVKVLGEVYTSLEGVLGSISKFFGSLPVSSTLRTSLKCAGMKIDAETYVAVISTLAFVSAAFMMVLVPSIGITAGLLNLQDVFSTSVLILVIGIFTFIVVGVIGLAYPNLQGKNRAAMIDRELPFALRHLSTQMSAGMSFQKALASVASADYGVLSYELRQTISRMDSGLSTEDALLDLSERTYSSGLKQATIQIVRALRTGGKISDIINAIAEDVAFETRMRVRDFTESLNLINIVYIMISVVAPVVATIMTAILQLPILGQGLSPVMIVSIFTGLAFAMVVILFVIKQLEPMAS